MQYGKKLRIMREERGLSTREVCEKVGYDSTNSLTNIERGNYHTSMAKLNELLKLYDVTPAEFFSDVTTMEIGIVNQANDDDGEVETLRREIYDLRKILGDFMSANGK